MRERGATERRCFQRRWPEKMVETRTRGERNGKREKEIWGGDELVANGGPI